MQFLGEYQETYWLTSVCYAGLLDKYATLNFLTEMNKYRSELFLAFEEFDWLRGDVDFQRAIARFDDEI